MKICFVPRVPSRVRRSQDCVNNTANVGIFRYRREHGKTGICGIIYQIQETFIGHFLILVVVLPDDNCRQIYRIPLQKFMLEIISDTRT